jgi:CubicO group peptidase (beta-lactamase class C family)
MTLDEYATEHLLDPIGMDPVDWWRDAEGHTLGYCCFDTTSRDFARLGLLYLHGGRWGGVQIVPGSWVEESVQPVAASEGDYGYQWWLEDLDGVPKDTFWAEGIDGQFIYVLPSLDMVVVRNGTYVKDPGPPVADPNLFAKYPSGSLVAGRGTSEPDEWRSDEFLGPIVEAARG